jgi:hypothetical protein
MHFTVRGGGGRDREASAGLRALPYGEESARISGDAKHWRDMFVLVCRDIIDMLSRCGW